jgi:hypothetical protein
LPPSCPTDGVHLRDGCVESFNGKLRDELLDREISYTLKEKWRC